jgi:hypothetical protein
MPRQQDSKNKYLLIVKIPFKITALKQAQDPPSDL